MSGAVDEEQQDNQGGQCDGDKDQHCEEQMNHGSNKHRFTRIKADWCLHRLSNILIYNLALTAATPERKHSSLTATISQTLSSTETSSSARTTHRSSNRDAIAGSSQVTKATGEHWKHTRLPLNLNANAKGYSYLSDDDIEMVEFYVDDHDLFLHDVAKEMGYCLMVGT